MSLTVAQSKPRKARSAHRPLTLEEEIFSLHSLAPATLSQLPALFAESVVDSATRVLGETTGEALVRCIGDSKLKEPEMVYERLDSFLQGGSDDMKKAIVQAFKEKVHRLYQITMDVSLTRAQAPLV